jgi:hypothetical protein
MLRLLTFAEKFRLDNPLVKRGSDVYQPNQPVNLTYDAFGSPAAFLRGLFEYLYRADSLVLVPHIPPGITELEQLDAVRFGSKKIHLLVSGLGSITGVRVNGRKWKSFDAASVTLAYNRLPKLARVEIQLGRQPGIRPANSKNWPTAVAVQGQGSERVKFNASLDVRLARVANFHQRLVAARLNESYEAAHAMLVLDCARVAVARAELRKAGQLRALPEASQVAADMSYGETVRRLCDGLEVVMSSYATSTNATRQKVFGLWTAAVSSL